MTERAAAPAAAQPATPAAAQPATPGEPATPVRPTLSAAQIADLLGQHRPTAEQTEVIEAPLSPMLVVAGAGSGKTETMSARVVWLIANGLVDPQEVLGLTFTRKAAGELAERVGKRLRQLRRARSGAGGSALDALDRPTISTYNSYAASLVTDHGLRIGREPGARLLSEASSWQVASDVVEGWHGDLGTEAAVSTVVAALLDLSNALSEHLLSTDDARAQIRTLLGEIESTPLGGKRTTLHADVLRLARSLTERHALLDVVDAFRERKRATDSIDFGDQVALAAQLAIEVPAVAQGERARFKVVLLDEYQDTSYAQIRLLQALFGDGHPVTAVGDPNQSIYGWRGASASGPARFPGQFRTAAGTPAVVHRLSTSWRNDLAILDVANTTSGPLYLADPDNSLPSLEARPAAGLGSVHGVYAATVEEEGAAIAEFVAKRWEKGRTTAAVLCRARSQFPVVEAALRMRGLPVEVVGLGGLLTTPEVVDLVALLEVVHDPSRGDSLMRLLTGPRLNLGVADLHALGARSAQLGRRTSAAGPVEGDASDERSIVDAVDDLPPVDWTGPDGRRFTPEGWARLRSLAALLRELRALTYLSLPELVAHAERALGLDIEMALVAAQDGGSTVRPAADPRGRAHLDAFRDVAASFADSSQTSTLGAFLAWLSTAEKRERGLDRPANAPDPDAVQLITVHASKGLEWDVVAVPGLVDGVFPSTRANSDKGPTSSGWLTGLGDLPFPLRGDAPDLPELELGGAADSADLNARLVEFRQRCGEHEVAEERRLAYVAFTRARSDLLLTGAWWRTAMKPTSPSLFLTELHDAGVLAEFTVSEQPDPAAPNPRDDLAREAVWPAERPASGTDDGAGPSGAESPGGLPGVSALDVLRASSALVGDALAAGPHADAPDQPAAPVLAQDGTDLVELSDILLAERLTARAAATAVDFPAHISASGLVEVARDRGAYALALRRPVPRQPSVHSRRGTAFHLWVERFYGSTSLFDMDDMPGADDDLVDEDATLADLQRTFESSVWASAVPLAVEVAIDTVVAGVITRTRIDAVFPDPERAGGVVVVDWKTGRAPRDADAAKAREVQLAVYRIAWSQWSGTPLEDVSAAFFYAADGTTVRPSALASLTELEALVRG